MFPNRKFPHNFLNAELLLSSKSNEVVLLLPACGYWPERQLTWLSFCVAYLSHRRRIPGQYPYLQLGHDCLLLRTFQITLVYISVPTQYNLRY
jgi:hypothetical protein